MLRDRMLYRRWLLYLIVAWGISVAAVPRVAEAAPLPPAREGALATDLETVRRVLEHKIVRDRLTELGVSPAEAEAALQRLSPEERSQLASRAHEIEAGGGVEILAFAIIIGLLVILILELLGRRVISRP